MPRHPDAIIIPNAAISKARQDQPSPRRPRQCMSRHELADAVNDALNRLYPKEKLDSQYVDFRWVGKLERGEHRWPSEHRRAALRHVFGASTDIALDLYSPRRTIGLYGSDSPATRLRRTSDFAIPDSSCDQITIDAVLAAGEPDSVTTWLDSLDGFRRALATQVDPNLELRVQRHLDVLEQLQSTGSRNYLAIVDARWSEFMSWVSENLGALGAGQWLERARDRAMQASDTTLTAYTLMRQSQRALLANDIRSAISLSRAALASGPSSTRTKVLCLSRMAEGLASNGDEEAFAVLAAAGRTLRRAADVQADMIATHCNERYVFAVEGRCRYLLGDSASAASILGDVLQPQPAVDQLDLGVWQVHIGEALASKDPEKAAEHGMRAIQIAQTSGSFRVVRAAQPLALSLRQYRSSPSVARFVTAHSQLVAEGANNRPWS